VSLYFFLLTKNSISGLSVKCDNSPCEISWENPYLFCVLTPPQHLPDTVASSRNLSGGKEIGRKQISCGYMWYPRSTSEIHICFEGSDLSSWLKSSCYYLLIAGVRQWRLPAWSGRHSSSDAWREEENLKTYIGKSHRWTNRIRCR